MSHNQKILHYCDACNDDRIAIVTTFDDKVVAECDTCHHKTSYWRVEK